MSSTRVLGEVEQVMQSAIARTRGYFNSEFKVSVDEVDCGAGDLDSLTLLDMTAIIGMGGGINLLVAFSFDEALINTLYQRMTDELDVQPDEVQLYREATAGEVVNTILGNCTMDLQKLGQQIISMTPPIVLDHAKTIRRMKNSMFYTQALHTKFGSMTISLVGPRELFNANLDYAK